MNDSNSIVPVDMNGDDARTLEAVVVGGDLSRLTPAQRVQWYRMRCEAAGLDPRTQPFQYLTLQGKLTLYATKTATEQLCAVRKISTALIGTQRIEDIYVVTCRATMPDGRFTEATGAVTLGNAKGDQLCNALMKAETKSKRRAVLALCGLGMMDESEVETVPGAQTESLNGYHAADHALQEAPEPLAGPLDIAAYNKARRVACLRGYKTPNGNHPKEADPAWTQREIFKRTNALNDWLAANPPNTPDAAADNIAPDAMTPAVADELATMDSELADAVAGDA